MKKFLKAVALATVMCMLLSVSAFAAEVVDGVTVNTLEPAKATDSIELEVVAAAGEEVALLVVAHDAELADLDDSEIEYIGQVNATGGVADFGSFTVKNANAKVDIYVGSASFATAKKIGEDIDLADVKKITIATGDNVKITESALGAGQAKTGYAAALTATVPDGLKIVAAKWAFKVGTDWVYSETVTDHNVDATVAGDVTFAAAFDAYGDWNETTQKFDPITVSDVAVIFLTGENIAAAKDDVNNTHYVADSEEAITAISNDKQ